MGCETELPPASLSQDVLSTVALMLCRQQAAHQKTTNYKIKLIPVN